MLAASTEQFSTSPISHDAHAHNHNHSHDNHHYGFEVEEEKNPFALTKESTLRDYLYNNKLWVEKMNDHKPHLFEMNGKGQSPHTLWIGCSDSRYNENVLNVSPGEVFTFKNIANMISVDDLTTKSTLEFSINVLKVKKIIVCGHTDCGGIWNSLSYKDLGPDNSHLMTYLKKIDDLRDEKLEHLNTISSLPLKAKRLAEYNVMKQLDILKKQKVVINALNKGDIELWGLIYNVDSGYLEVVEA
ncbi:Carbonic anhydrase [Cyberlindnera fabianii]|nr:Carbonic anhydrase [Cyberlindnera fabianii]